MSGRDTITLMHDGELRPGDLVRVEGTFVVQSTSMGLTDRRGRAVVVAVPDHSTIEVRPATWWRRAWWWMRRKAGWR